MTGLDPHLVVRAGTVYVVVLATTALWLWRRPPARARAPALLAAIWNMPTLLALNLAAPRLGWWTFDADGGLLLGIPVDLYLAWAWLWGAIPALAFPRLPIGVGLLAAGALDVVAMPLASPVVRLGPQWLVGEAAGLVLCLLPAQLLARWTAADTRLPARILLQVAAFAGLTLFLVPAVALDTTGWRWVSPIDRPLWQLTIIAQVLAAPMLIGVAVASVADTDPHHLRACGWVVPCGGHRRARARLRAPASRLADRGAAATPARPASGYPVARRCQRRRASRAACRTDERPAIPARCRPRSSSTPHNVAPVSPGLLAFALVPRPLSFVPRPLFLVPRPSSFVPCSLFLVPRPSSLVLRPLFLVPCPSSPDRDLA